MNGRAPDGGGSSRLPGFHQRDIADRRALIGAACDLDPHARAHLASGGGLDVEIADRMSENVLGSFALPLSVALNFRVNGRDVVIPMATEEASVVAAASNAARMARPSGGFEGDADPAIMTAQIELFEVADVAAAARAITEGAPAVLAAGDRAIPRMVARGGGCRALEARAIDPEAGVLVVHVHVDVGDAMGANLVDTVAEAVAEPLARLAGGKSGLRILTNLALGRRVRIRATVRDEDLGSAELADAVARASRLAELDVFRAVTHNKGFMNGVVAAALALGQDTRAIEAGAHGWAALGAWDGASEPVSRVRRVPAYAPLSTWRRVPGGIEGRAELPLAVGTVGGACSSHPGVRSALSILRARSAGDLAIAVAAAGLACNLAALRALAGEGIQRGHMRLHRRKGAAAGGGA